MTSGLIVAAALKLMDWRHIFMVFGGAGCLLGISFVWLLRDDFATPWPAARQTSLSITNSRSLLKLMSIKSVMSSNHLIHISWTVAGPEKPL